MRIAIEASNVLYGSSAIRRYVVNLIQHLVRIDRENSYLAFYTYFRKSPYSLLKFPDEINNFKNISSSVPASLWWTLWNITGYPKIESLIGNIDIFHATDFFVPPKRNARIVFTIHGISYIKAPQFYDRIFCKKSSQMLHNAIKRGDYFIAVSNKTKMETLELYPFLEDRIRVIPLGVGEEFRVMVNRSDISNRLKERFSIDSPYILYAGGLERSKNVLGLIEAYKLLCDKKKPEHLLIMAGNKGRHYLEIMDKVEEYGLKDSVIFTGYIEQEGDDLTLLYNGADLFVFPSFYEGWASPPLEAMKCGCPVITSNISSLPETVDDAAIKVNPYLPEEIADAIYNVLTDGELRNNLVKKGLEWANQFGWERTAKEHLGFYKSMCKTEQ